MKFSTIFATSLAVLSASARPSLKARDSQGATMSTYNITSPFYAEYPEEFCTAWNTACYFLATVNSISLQAGQGASCNNTNTTFIEAGCSFQIPSGVDDATAAVGAFFVTAEVLSQSS